MTDIKIDQCYYLEFYPPEVGGDGRRLGHCLNPITHYFKAMVGSDTLFFVTCEKHNRVHLFPNVRETGLERGSERELSPDEVEVLKVMII